MLRAIRHTKLRAPASAFSPALDGPGDINLVNLWRCISRGRASRSSVWSAGPEWTRRRTQNQRCDRVGSGAWGGTTTRDASTAGMPPLWLPASFPTFLLVARPTHHRGSGLGSRAIATCFAASHTSLWTHPQAYRLQSFAEPPFVQVQGDWERDDRARFRRTPSRGSSVYRLPMV